MEINVDELEVRHNPDKKRFEVTLGDQLGVVTYRRQGETYVFLHTEVPPEFGGRGIADRMARVALDTVRAEGGNVLPLCPFIKVFIKRHEEYQDLVRKTNDF